MRWDTTQKVEGAVERWRREYSLILAEQAYREYVTGAAEMHRAMNIAVDWMVIDEAALLYAQEYGQLLEAEGASWIGGQKVPWLRELADTRRAEVSEIIQRGIGEGKHPGTRELARGGYSKGTIARDLQDYFGDRRSHATMVARTETARIRNQSRLKTCDERGYKVVRVSDGQGANPCDVCRAMHGQFWTTEYAQLHDLEHPHCTRHFVPVRPEVYEGQPIVGIR